MLTRDERRAVLFLGAVAALGGLLRVVREGRAAPGEAIVAPEIAGDDLVRQAALARRAQELARPLGAGERVDLDRAAAEEIQRLPRIGPELARRIVRDRESHGAFGSLQGLARVPGIGPGTLRLLGDVVTFSGVSAQAQAAAPAAVAARRSSVPDGAASRTAAPPGATSGSRRNLPAACPEPPLNLNRASLAELDCLPGVGRRLAERIVAERELHGPFREVKELERVAGLGARRIARLSAYLSAP